MCKKLLVIDDQTGMTKVVSHIATGLGYEVKAVTDSTQAIDTFLDFMPDVVVLDLVMPKKDGIDVLNEILATGVQSRVIVMTGYGDGYLRLAEGLAKFHDNDRVSVMRKPFRRNDLVDLLDKITDCV
jgi:CheY-like chemotaxis protein